MSFEVIVSNRFQRKLKRLSKKYVSVKADFSILLDVLEQQPATEISLGRDCYKVRMLFLRKAKAKAVGPEL